MENPFFEVLKKHTKLYPEMQAEDYLKLAFQSEFGCGHLLKDKEAAKSYLSKELESVDAEFGGEPLTDIGGGFARLELASVKRSLSHDVIFKLFEKSSSLTGCKKGFYERLALILKASEEGIVKLEYKALENCFKCFRLGEEIPSHSDIYRKKYRPAYRIIDKSFAPLIPICELITSKLQSAKKFNIAIDGRAASGKTTLALMLAEIFDADVIHMDDFFLPFERKTPERLSIPGGNVDSERFFEEVYSHIFEDSIEYGRFDCAKQQISEKIVLKRKQLLIIEGAYSLLPQFRDKYSVKIFSDTDHETQKQRIKDRNGEKMLSRFINEWIPLEEAYFKALLVREAADAIYYTI